VSDFSDETLGRYLGQQPGMREAFHTDPLQHAQVEWMRQILAAAERAMADEGVPDETRRRVINRIVWGEPEGQIDMHARMRETREQVLAAYDLPTELTDAWKALRVPPVRPGEETTS
jgi:hypothetical protein